MRWLGRVMGRVRVVGLGWLGVPGLERCSTGETPAKLESCSGRDKVRVRVRGRGRDDA